MLIAVVSDLVCRGFLLVVLVSLLLVFSRWCCFLVRCFAVVCCRSLFSLCCCCFSFVTVGAHNCVYVFVVDVCL